MPPNMSDSSACSVLLAVKRRALYVRIFLYMSLHSSTAAGIAATVSSVNGTLMLSMIKNTTATSARFISRYGSPSPNSQYIVSVSPSTITRHLFLESSSETSMSS